MMSGRRKEPPISISSPRETTTSRPGTRAARTSSVAAALLLTRATSSAPVREQTRSRMACSRWMREPSPMSICRLQQPMQRRTASRAAEGIGARPRPVWRRMPVALTAGLRFGSSSRDSARRVSSSSASGVGGGRSVGEALIAWRHASTVARSASAARSRPNWTASSAKASISSIRPVCGMPLSAQFFMPQRLSKPRASAQAASAIPTTLFYRLRRRPRSRWGTPQCMPRRRREAPARATR